MADWDEIKRLAADFQRTQASDTLQRISERNCIDIVKKLTDSNLIELIYTCDGKEFITPAHLLKEIEDEIYASGGRMHLHDLASNLNVDYQHVENKAKELTRERPEEYSLILGQVIHSSYKNTLGKQIYDCMLVNGQLSIADFAKTLDLPSEFLLTIVKEILPKDYVVSQDERTYYTSDVMDRYKSIIAGTLSAILKPTTIASLMKRLDIPERIFMPIVDGLIKDGRTDASIENRLFIPSIYAREQSEYINKFYSSNSYIEYDLLSRMDIKQPKAFLKKRYPDGIHLKTCFISSSLLSQVESLIEDSIASNGWIDIGAVLPSAIEAEDIEQVLQDIIKKNKQFSSSCMTFKQTHICSLGYIAACKSSFTDLMQAKAQQHLRQGRLISHFMGGKLKRPPNKDAQSKEEKTDELSTGDKAQAQDSKEAAKDENATSQTLDADDLHSGTERGGKKERKDKKNKTDIESDDSDADDRGGKKSKSRKSGGGTQGREIKHKSVKKKYIPGNKSKGQGNDGSDEENNPSKAPRSTKGRAARRAMSPERPATAAKSKVVKLSTSLTQKEPLIFMSTEELVDKIKSRGSGECTEEFFEFIAKTIEDELNMNYEALAKQVLDEYLKSQTTDEFAEPSNEDDVEIVE